MVRFISPPIWKRRAGLSDATDEDRHAVARMYRLAFDLVQELHPEFQIIATDHADLSDNWFQDSIIERWRGGIKLVPEDWPVTA
jgi:hypothetical protein